MPSAAAIRFQIEASLAHRIPSALTPMPRAIRPVAPTGIAAIDNLLEGGLPLGAVTELVGPECSGRTSVALSFLTAITRTGTVAAWVDVCDAFHPESAAASGIDLARLLWVRCGLGAKREQPQTDNTFHLPQKYLVPPPVLKGLHGCGCGGHPRGEVKGLSRAVGEFLRPESIAPRCAEPQPREKQACQSIAPVSPPARAHPGFRNTTPWARIDQALRATDLLLQAGGFAAIVLDMGGIAPQHASRVPLATWFRYRAAAEKTQASLLLLTQYACAKSSCELQLRFLPGEESRDEATVFTGIHHRIEIERKRFAHADANVIPMRKPPRREATANWRSHAPWAGAR